jgi:hypothetical protein
MINICNLRLEQENSKHTSAAPTNAVHIMNENVMKYHFNLPGI